MRHNAAQPYEILWFADGERRQITTLSEREARRILAEKRAAGLDPSLYVGNFEIDAMTPAENRRRVAVAQAGENAYQREGARVRLLPSAYRNKVAA